MKDAKQVLPSDFDIVQATPSLLKVVQKSDKECNNAQENGEEKGSSNSHEHEHQPKQSNKEADVFPLQHHNNLPRGKEELKKVHIQSLLLHKSNESYFFLYSI